MTTEFQPIDPRIPFYIPENWIQPSASGGGSFVNFPTAQTANISFPGTILCSNLQSFAPSAPMNLFNNSTTGNIEIANANGYTGGIVINANGFAPDGNKIRIGDSSRPLIAPLIHTTEIRGTGTFGSIVNVNSDLLVNTGYSLYADTILKNTASFLSIGAPATAVRIIAGIDRPIPLLVSNSTYGTTNLTGSQTDTSTLATANINANNVYVYRYFPAASVTGRYYAQICITFECSSHFSPWIQWTVYRRSTAITTNTTVLGTDTRLVNFNVIQKYYTTILTDKMTVNLVGIIDFNPARDTSNYYIGVAADWLDTGATFTLSQVTTDAVYMRLS